MTLRWVEATMACRLGTGSREMTGCALLGFAFPPAPTLTRSRNVTGQLRARHRTVALVGPRLAPCGWTLRRTTGAGTTTGSCRSRRATTSGSMRSLLWKATSWMALDSATRYKLETMIAELEREFGGEFDRSRIEELTADSVERLSGAAVVAEFLPILAYRFTRERLLALRRSDTSGDSLDVVFVSLSGGGRGQLASALTARLSGGVVTARAAGTAAEADLDPSVRTVLEELGIDTSEAFVRPATDEVFRAADLIVTMGHSVGAVDIPEGVR